MRRLARFLHALPLFLVSLPATLIAAAAILLADLAWAVLGEPPPAATLAGGPLILVGVFMALRQ